MEINRPVTEEEKKIDHERVESEIERRTREFEELYMEKHQYLTDQLQRRSLENLDALVAAYTNEIDKYRAGVEERR